MSIGVIILAAGKGTRMNSKYQKILHEVGGKPMVQHIYEAAAAMSDVPPVFIVGEGEVGVQELIGEQARYVVQTERLGTGHATMMAESTLKGKVDQIIVMNGDTPLVQAHTLQRLAVAQAETGAAVVIMSILGEKETSFGRIIRNAQNHVTEICEVAEAKRRPNTDEILAIPDLNAGEYCFSAEFLWQNIHNLPLRQARSGTEYYITDMIELAIQQGLHVEAVTATDPLEGLGAGTRAELLVVEKAFRQRAINKALAAGVTIIDPEHTYIDQNVSIGQDTIIWPNTFLQGNTIIGEDCVIGPNAIVRDCAVGNNCLIEQAVLERVSVPADSYIEPFTHATPIGED